MLLQMLSTLNDQMWWFFYSYDGCYSLIPAWSYTFTPLFQGQKYNYITNNLTEREATKFKLPSANGTKRQCQKIFLGVQKFVMACILFLLCVLLETSKVVTGINFFDSSDYKIINDIQKCRGNFRLKTLC